MKRRELFKFIGVALSAPVLAPLVALSKPKIVAPFVDPHSAIDWSNPIGRADGHISIGPWETEAQLRQTMMNSDGVIKYWWEKQS